MMGKQKDEIEPELDEAGLADRIRAEAVALHEIMDALATHRPEVRLRILRAAVVLCKGD
jgi:hypothetical protein